jgi:outer membrane protein assembly factor BamB
MDFKNNCHICRKFGNGMRNLFTGNNTHGADGNTHGADDGKQPFQPVFGMGDGMNCLLRAAILSAVILFAGCGGREAGQEGKDDWLLFRGDAGLSGSTEANLPEHPVVLWTYRSGERTSSSPVVCGGTVYWSDKRGRIRGVGADGVQVFDYRFETAVEATPMICDSVLYIGRIDGYMSALSIATGDTLWNFETMGQVSASPNAGMFGGRRAIVFGSYDNFLYCLDAESGRCLARFESGYYINGATGCADGCFVSGGCDAWLRIVDARSGLTSDSVELDTYLPASPAIIPAPTAAGGDYCYIADHSGNVYETVIREGRIVSHGKIVTAPGEGGSSVCVPAVTERTLFVLSDDRCLYAVDRTDGTVRWKYMQKGSSGESSPVAAGDRVVSCTRDGIVSILDASDGRLLWEYDTGEQITASPAVIEGFFYILTGKGTLFRFGNK